MSQIRFTYEAPSDTVELQRRSIFGIWRVVYSMPYDHLKALYDQATILRGLYLAEEDESK